MVCREENPKDVQTIEQGVFPSIVFGLFCFLSFKIRLYWGHVDKEAFLHLSLTGQDKTKPK